MAKHCKCSVSKRLWPTNSPCMVGRMPTSTRKEASEQSVLRTRLQEDVGKKTPLAKRQRHVEDKDISETRYRVVCRREEEPPETNARKTFVVTLRLTRSANWNDKAAQCDWDQTARATCTRRREAATCALATSSLDLGSRYLLLLEGCVSLSTTAVC